MSQDDTGEKRERRDFFISYTISDRQWAEWIAMQLEEAGYTLFIQAWDFRPGSNFVAEMDNAAKCAERTLLVLSPAYLESDYAFAEWATAFRHDPKGAFRRLLPVRIEPCNMDGLLGSVVYIDLVSLDEMQAKDRLLSGVQLGRAKPATVAFPGQNISHAHVAFPGSLPPIWNIPYPRNPVFTGRKHLLAQLANALQPGEAVALTQPQAISGLGGIGKTQLAVEYAYQHLQDYQAVLWTRADTAEALIAGYVEIARLLDLPQKNEQNQSLVVKAVQEWLKQQTRWLLILDNADDLTIVREFLPPACGGHIMLTTRAQAIGRVAQRIEVDMMDPEAGTLLLLRRAGLVATDASLNTASHFDNALARAITKELGGLPLALDQAGAYIEETACGLAAYQRLYQVHQVELLHRRGGFVNDHPESVATTWSISFDQVEQRSLAAADLLRLCAFLAPDTIPEELLFMGAKELEEVHATLAADEYQLDRTITVLRAYSLIVRDPQARTLTIHRLVQAVLRNSMPAETQQQWMQRAVNIVSAAIPSIEFANWSTIDCLLPHALLCASWIESARFATREAIHLLKKAGYYLHFRARYAEAEPLCQKSLAICEQVFGPEHPDTAQNLNDLAWLYLSWGKYAQAEPLYHRSLVICEQILGPEHPDTARNLNDLAWLYRSWGKYAQAEPLCKRSLAIREQHLGAEHPDTASSLNNLANLYQSQGRYTQAEPLYERALAICEQILGPEHPDTAENLNDLAYLYRSWGKYAQAEPLYERALAIRERQLGGEHPATQIVRENYTVLLEAMKEAEATE